MAEFLFGGPGIQVAVLNLESGWETFESELLSVSTQTEFSEFVSRYRGIPDNEPTDNHRNFVSTLVTNAVQNWIVKAVVSGWNSEWHNNNDEKFSEYLFACESAANLALYYWHAPNDRNLQYRTFIHFAEISAEPIFISLGGGLDFFIRLTEWGVQLSVSDSFEPFPKRFSLAKACNLSTAQWSQSLQDTEISCVIADLRVIQREFCQLIDEWEHCNSILAVRQFGLRKLPNSEQAQAQRIFSEIGRTRDLLAQWCACSAADFQLYVSEGLLVQGLHPDVRAELATTDALLLSGLQKLYLPASVSRHVYSTEVITEFRRFAAARLRSEPEDMCSLISQAAFSLALSDSPEWQELLSNLEKTSFYWSLSADPSASIKSVAWSFSTIEHQLLTALLILILHAKREPDPLDFYWLQAISSVVEMPATFNKDRPQRDDWPVGTERQLQLCQKAICCLNHFSSDENEENQSALQYIVEFLKSDLRLIDDEPH